MAKPTARAETPQDLIPSFERPPMPKASHTKPQIISAIKVTARRLRRTPTRSEFQSLTGIHWTKVQRLFGGYRAAVREAGLEPDPGGIRIDTAAMLEDFGRLARKLKRHPTREEYEKLGRYASASLETRFHRWSAVRESFLEFVAKNGLEREWGDVAERLCNGPVPRRGGGTSWRKAKPVLPRINADKRGSNRNLLPQINTDDHPSRRKPRLPGAPADEHRSEAEPVRAEILYPQLSGMRCVTRTVLWAMCATATSFNPASLKPTSLKHGRTEEAEEQLTADWTDERGLRNSHARQIGGTDKSVSTPTDQRAGLLGTSVCATRDWSQETERTDKSVCATRFRMNESIEMREALSVPALHFARRVIPGRPVMGPPLMLHGLACEPVNEAGVVFLFGMVAHRLGFWVDSLQMAYPDCEAKLEMEPGLWQHVHIEFEYESRHFRAHRHDEKKCDILVCWRHNWKGCPKEIQVVEMRKLLGR